MKIINKTPHPVYILAEDGETVIKAFPKSRGMIRLQEVAENVGNVNGIPITSTRWGDTIDTPPVKPNVYYIVSQLVKTALPDRPDLLTAKNIVRDDQGVILGCKSLDIGSALNTNHFKNLKDANK